MAAKSPQAIENQRRRCRVYYAANRDTMRAQQAVYRAEHIEEKREMDAAYYREHADEIKARVTEAFHTLSPEEKLERGRRNRATEGRETRRERSRAEATRLRNEIITGYGGACSCCGSSYLPHLTIDHVNGGGTAHRRELKGSAFYRYLRRESFPEGFQVMCWNCNWAKHVLGRCACQDAEGVIAEHV